MSENFQSLEKSGAETSNHWKFHRIAGSIFFYLVTAGAVLFAGLLLYSIRCAISHARFDPTGDCAHYANMMWNTAHGRPFVFNAGADSYLQVHLSFTLGVAGFLFRVFDHPLMPAYLQWALVIGGGIFLALAAARARLPRAATAALLLYWTAYYFVQSVLLSGFHGVSFYLLLVPALYYTLLKERLVWLPLIAILGIREEAGLMIAPLLFYFAARHDRRGVRVLGFAALLYCVVAMFVLFPAINGLSIFERRAADLRLLGSVNPSRYWKIATSVMWVALPWLGFVRRGWRPLLIVPSVALITALMSGHARQYSLASHYPALLHSLIAVAMIEAARSAGDEAATRRAPSWRALIAPAWLVVATLASHYFRGFLPGSATQPGGRDLAYKTMQPLGRHALRVAQKKVPREGVVSTETQFAMFVANRRDLQRGDVSRTPQQCHDIAFCRRISFPDLLRDELAAGRWGVLYSDDLFVVVKIGADTSQNAAFLAAGNRSTCLPEKIQ